jgi:hypothetical protein
MKPAIEWEYIGSNCERAKVFGGWMVKHTIYDNSSNFGDRGQPQSGDSVSRINLIFVPDEGHAWDMDTLLKAGVT